jgi:hypothetical protein
MTVGALGARPRVMRTWALVDVTLCTTTAKSPPATVIVRPTGKAERKSRPQPSTADGVPSSRTEVSRVLALRRSCTPASRPYLLAAVPSHASRPFAERYSSHQS